MKTLELSNICKHEITNNFKKNIKKAKSKALLMYLCVILLFVVNTGINTLNIVKNYNIINNPVNSLYNIISLLEYRSIAQSEYSF